MTLEDEVHACRPQLFRRVQELGNVNAACRNLTFRQKARIRPARERAEDIVPLDPDGKPPTRDSCFALTKEEGGLGGPSRAGGTPT